MEERKLTVNIRSLNYTNGYRARRGAMEVKTGHLSPPDTLSICVFLRSEGVATFHAVLQEELVSHGDLGEGSTISDASKQADWRDGPLRLLAGLTMYFYVLAQSLASIRASRVVILIY